MPAGILSKTEYQQILQNPSVYLTDQKLKVCQVEKEPVTGLPRVRSGGLALTYCVTFGNKKWALRCFHKLAQDREQHYRAITKFLTQNKSDTLVGIEYQAQGIRYQGNFYPLTLMEWVEGETLGTYIYNNIRNPGVIRSLPDQFLHIIQELDRLQIAHGDLSHSNIIMSKGRLILIDYDGMYVPELHGQRSTEIGNLSFQHPGRNETIFNPRIDRFSEIVIYLALKAISISPQIYQSYGLGREGLLFDQSDFRVPDSSRVIAELEKVSALSGYMKNFKQLCRSNVATMPSLWEFLENRPIEVQLAPASPIPYTVPHGSWPLDATKSGELLEYEGENVVVIGQIDHIRHAQTRYGLPYVFLNVGIWPNQALTVVMWSEVLNLLEFAGRSYGDFQDNWISVSGIISTYKGKPQIILESPADIAIITEDEAKDRLNRINRISTQPKTRPISHLDVPEVQKPGEVVTPNTPSWVQSVSVQKIDIASRTSQPTSVTSSGGPKVSTKPSFSNPSSPSSSSLIVSNTQVAKPKVDVTGQLNKLYGPSGQYQNHSSAITPPLPTSTQTTAPTQPVKTKRVSPVIPSVTKAQTIKLQVGLVERLIENIRKRIADLKRNIF